jgi:DNA-binding transcriptional regulator YhcF (GntR family)
MSDVVEKWGQSVAERGFAQIPNYLLLVNQFLDPRLSPIEVLVLLELAGGWWQKDSLPFPSVATLATRCGASGRQIQRAIANLEKREFLKRVTRRNRGIIASNAYDLAPLVSVLAEIAKRFPNEFPRKTVRNRVTRSAAKAIDPDSDLAEFGKMDISDIPEKR